MKIESKAINLHVIPSDYLQDVLLKKKNNILRTIAPKI